MRTNSPPAALHAAGRAYSFLLLFYPAPLRSRFGPEMSSVFEEQTHAAWQESGYTGVLESWWRALAEVICIAFPARLERLKIPAISLLLSLFLAALFFANAVPAGHCHK
jgi:hypothetical protein